MLKRTTRRGCRITYGPPVGEAQEPSGQAGAAKDDELAGSASHRVVQGSDGPSHAPQPRVRDKFLDIRPKGVEEVFALLATTARRRKLGMASDAGSKRSRTMPRQTMFGNAVASRPGRVSPARDCLLYAGSPSYRRLE